MSEWHACVPETADGARLDRWVAAALPDESRSRLQALIRGGFLQVNGQAVATVSLRLKTDDKVALVLPDPEPLSVEPEALPLEVVYEDADVIVVNKPRGLVVHPAPGHLHGTLVNALLEHCHDLSGINGVLRPGIVHRIDKDTSGLLMAAKNDKAHRSLAQQLKDKTTERLYVAIVHGAFDQKEGTINAPIGRDTRDRKKMAITAHHSKQAVTHFRVLESFQRYTYVACRLETGRTHQIRVHMAYIDHPLAGDPKYGPRKTLPIGGQALHAAELGFIHPRTGDHLLFKAKLPEDMRQLLEQLRAGIYD
ncbi:MAG: RluA family pseudouridine synthase [Sporolactobacillus sp.]